MLKTVALPCLSIGCGAEYNKASPKMRWSVFHPCCLYHTIPRKEVVACILYALLITISHAPLEMRRVQRDLCRSELFCNLYRNSVLPYLYTKMNNCCSNLTTKAEQNIDGGKWWKRLDKVYMILLK